MPTTSGVPISISNQPQQKLPYACDRLLHRSPGEKLCECSASHFGAIAGARREQSDFPAAASLNRLYRQCSGGYILCAPTVSRPEHWRGYQQLR